MTSADVWLEALPGPLARCSCGLQRVSDHAAIRDCVDVEPEGLLLWEVAPNVSPEDVQERTEPQLRPSPDLRETRL